MKYHTHPGIRWDKDSLFCKVPNTSGHVCFSEGIPLTSTDSSAHVTAWVSNIQVQELWPDDPTCSQKVTGRESQAAAATAKTETKNKNNHSSVAVSQKVKGEGVCLYVHHIVFLRVPQSTLFEMWKQLRSRFASWLLSPNLKWRNVTASSCFLTPCNDTFSCTFHPRFG